MPEQVKNNDASIFEVQLPKRMTFDDNRKFSMVMDELSASDCSLVVFDISKTEFMDSAGLGLLLLAREIAGKGGKQVILRKPKPYVAKLFKITRFDELFKIEN